MDHDMPQKQLNNYSFICKSIANLYFNACLCNTCVFTLTSFWLQTNRDRPAFALAFVMGSFFSECYI